MATKTNYKLTKKDFNQINRRNLFFNQLGWNYEKMQGSGYLFLMLPQLRKLYGDHTPELKKAMKTHNQFFNTNPWVNTIIQGIDLAIESKEGAESLETVSGLKTGLMGPLAAIGDSIFASLLPAILGAIAANMAVQGNPFGVVIWLIANLIIMYIRWIQLPLAYREGTTLVTKMQGQLNALTDAATLLGVYVVGALVATLINIQVPFVAHIGKVTVTLQNEIDMILPKLVPGLLVGLIYWLLGRKKMTSTKAIFTVIIVAVVCSALGILGKG
ncbi:PTS system mannose/fructose/sorbose family transporter subunit IID [Liquorilactobacillus mali]|uniref:Phosphotransferase system, mannose fructose N-acetylgalactosamine-specific component IID n=1 Tax=Liquorilactobacillus mali TaxID=1618 RepID=A0A0R2FV65_9LACO|nr:PTS system mannose/fructose/sorbose family transporter subunit IID [Liquorilactobacillus mali]KRN32136.1 phosphotransferase system, mannose fructose N-acetylgalactosamine-specific component IID [Liquorilactobacillus mali]